MTRPLEPESVGLAPLPQVRPPAPVRFRLTWSERVSLGLIAAVLVVTGFCGSYELKSALGINLVKGYHLQDVLPFYPRFPRG